MFHRISRCESRASKNGIAQRRIGDNLAVQGNPYFRNKVVGIEASFKQLMVDGYGIVGNNDPIGDNKQ